MSTFLAVIDVISMTVKRKYHVKLSIDIGHYRSWIISLVWLFFGLSR